MRTLPSRPDGFYSNPDHPLYGVPDSILRNGRSVARDAATYGGIDPEHADSIADAVTMAVLDALVAWLAEKGRDAHSRSTTSGRRVETVALLGDGDSGILVL